MTSAIKFSRLGSTNQDNDTVSISGVMARKKLIPVGVNERGILHIIHAYSIILKAKSIINAPIAIPT